MERERGGERERERGTDGEKGGESVSVVSGLRCFSWSNARPYQHCKLSLASQTLSLYSRK